MSNACRSVHRQSVSRQQMVDRVSNERIASVHAHLRFYARMIHQLFAHETSTRTQRGSMCV
eukprot:595365-Amphidinium_carterae.1